MCMKHWIGWNTNKIDCKLTIKIRSKGKAPFIQYEGRNKKEARKKGSTVSESLTSSHIIIVPKIKIHKNKKLSEGHSKWTPTND